MDRSIVEKEKAYFLNGGSEVECVFKKSKWIIYRQEYGPYYGCCVCGREEPGKFIYYVEVYSYRKKYDEYNIEKSWSVCSYFCANRIRERHMDYYDKIPAYIDAMNFRVPGHYGGSVRG